jgi:hypothetical protein
MSMTLSDAAPYLPLLLVAALLAAAIVIWNMRNARMTLSGAVPCFCGKMPMAEIGRPAADSSLYRIACSCGHASPHWSASAPTAIHFWNSIIAAPEQDDEQE